MADIDHQYLCDTRLYHLFCITAKLRIPDLRRRYHLFSGSYRIHESYYQLPIDRALGPHHMGDPAHVRGIAVCGRKAPL